MTWLIAFIQALVFVVAAPLLSGWVKWVKCHLQNRRAPSPLQPYRDLFKLMGKSLVIAEQASRLFRTVPYIVFATTALVAAVIPLAVLGLPTSDIGDVIVLVGLLALARFFLALGGMDIGTAFGGMGSSREVTLASVAEPAMLMAVFTLAMTANSTNLSVAITHILEAGVVLRPSFVFAAAGLLLVAVAETGRIPVDNPATHLELTMVHEAMILEYSGRHLGLIEWASQIKLLVYGVLLVNIFFPWGIATVPGWAGLATGLSAVTIKLFVLGILLPIVETAMAKMRLFRVPQYLSLAFLFSLLGMLSHIILEIGG